MIVFPNSIFGIPIIVQNVPLGSVGGTNQTDQTQFWGYEAAGFGTVSFASMVPSVASVLVGSYAGASFSGAVFSTNVAIGYQAMFQCTRDMTGNVAIGGGSLVVQGAGTAIENVAIGDSSGGNCKDYNTVVGSNADVAAGASNCTVLGSYMNSPAGDDWVILGSSNFMRYKCNNVGTGDFLDNSGASIFGIRAKNAGAGGGYGSPACTFANLPTVGLYAGLRAAISDSTLAYAAANIGAAAAGGGANFAPVIYNGASWRIG